MQDPESRAKRMGDLLEAMQRNSERMLELVNEMQRKHEERCRIYEQHLQKLLQIVSRLPRRNLSDEELLALRQGTAANARRHKRGKTP